MTDKWRRMGETEGRGPQGWKPQSLGFEAHESSHLYMLTCSLAL